MNESFFLMIDDPSRLAESRRIATQVAEREGMAPDVASNAAIVASELASNLWKHAQQGGLHIAPLSGHGEPGIEILSVDRGPGIQNLSECLKDGHSTAGTAGTGIGAVRRLSDAFDIHSQPGKGTVVLSQIWAKAPAGPGSGFTLGLLSRPVSGETVSGDAWAVRRGQDAVLIMVADGLGHGILAAEASSAAVDAFNGSTEPSPAGLVRAIHAALRSTRGAAVAVASVEFSQARVRFAGLGNIAGTVVASSKSHSMVSHNGTAGHAAHHIKEFLYPWTEESIIVMHSDGLSTNWNLEVLPALRRYHPSVIGGLLYRDAARERDDACVIVGKRQ
jgi:anti-sigma regulatory factor (Ser/Thr protein kinase)